MNNKTVQINSLEGFFLKSIVIGYLNIFGVMQTNLEANKLYFLT